VQAVNVSVETDMDGIRESRRELGKGVEEGRADVSLSVEVGEG